MNPGSAPYRLLLELVLLAVAIGGVIYGYSHRGDPLQEDLKILDLYRRIEALEEENGRLQREIEALN